MWSIYPLPIESKRLRVPGIGQLNLAWNPQIRMGGFGFLELEFDAAELGIGGNAGNETGINNMGDVRQFSLDSTDHILVETRVEIQGVQIEPGEELIQPVRSGQNLTFKWQIAPYQSGDIEGELWIYLKILSADRGDVNRLPISIQSFHTQAVDLLGLTGQTARIFGIMGICIALIMWRTIIGGYASRFLRWVKNS